MWIFTDLGFYSINRTPDGKRLQFRSRRKQDLVNLKRQFREEFKGEAVKTIQHADYRWRLETTSGEAGIVMCALTERIEYRNFKNHIATTDQADKLDIMHRLWAILYDYQTAQETPRKRKSGRWIDSPLPEADTYLGEPEHYQELFPLT